MAARAIHDGLFRVADDGTIRLLGGYSPSSAKYHFPRMPVCPYTGADDVEGVELSDHATLWGFTAVTAPPPGFDGDVPFGFGVVELPEGLRVITRITESDPARLSFGMPMRLVATPVRTDKADGGEGDGDGDGEVVTWAFEPASEPDA